MSALEKFFAGAFVLIAIYLILTSQQTGNIITSFATGSSQVFATLQGRGAGAQISYPFGQ